jgi:hypothetical protein
VYAMVDLSRSMPNRIDLTVPYLTIADPASFALLPKLTILRELEWPYADIDRASDISTHFPSLTLLEVASGPSTSLHWSGILCSIPHLKSVRWKRGKRVDPRDIERNAEAGKRERERLRAERLKADAAKRAVLFRGALVAPVDSVDALVDWYKGEIVPYKLLPAPEGSIVGGGKSMPSSSMPLAAPPNAITVARKTAAKKGARHGTRGAPTAALTAAAVSSPLADSGAVASPFQPHLSDAELSQLLVHFAKSFESTR